MRAGHHIIATADRAPEPLRGFDEIVREYEPALRRLTVSYASDPADQDDLYQEITAAIWSALPRFRGDASERTWVYRIAHNVAISASLRARRRSRRETWLQQDAASPSPNPEDQSADNERRRLLIEAVRSIHGLDKQILVLHLEGLTNAEVGDVAGLSEGAVATRLSRVRAQLAHAIQASIQIRTGLK